MIGSVMPSPSASPCTRQVLPAPRSPCSNSSGGGAGIGGAVGLKVGDAMRALAATHQVFAITHLPQIAARAHHHVQVAKAAKGGVTTTDVAAVVGEAREREIARMLGGDADSDVGRAHARELLAVSAAPASTSATARRRSSSAEGSSRR